MKAEDVPAEWVHNAISAYQNTTSDLAIDWWRAAIAAVAPLIAAAERASLCDTLRELADDETRPDAKDALNCAAMAIAIAAFIRDRGNK